MIIDFAKADYGKEEIDAVNRVLHSDLLASGPENEAFEKEFAHYVGAKYAVCCNSGSSANLLALSALGLSKDGYVLTSACGFPATLNPILHLGLNPLLVDYDSHTHNICVSDVLQEMTKVKAIIFAHTLGNPVQMEMILNWAANAGIPVIEDCCEAVGTKGIGLGDLATWSFYPAHQMTALGGGGMVTTNNEEYYQRMKSLRDWGKQYTWDSSRGGNVTQYDSVIGYHSGYTYTSIGWNFKLPEANCAFGREQLKKLDGFRKIRMKNWNYLYEGLKDMKEIFIAPISEDASPFGFCMDVTGDRNKFGAYLEANGIKHRPFFAGNILRQPAFRSEDAWRFPTADYLMEHSLFIGCHTKLTKENLDYMLEVIRAFYLHPKLQREGLSGRVSGEHTSFNTGGTITYR